MQATRACDRRVLACDPPVSGRRYASIAPFLGILSRPTASAIGVHAVEHHQKRVRFFSTVELVNALEHQKSQGRPSEIANVGRIPISLSWTNLAMLQ